LGQCGNAGDYEDSPGPPAYQGVWLPVHYVFGILTNAIAIAAGELSSYAIRNDGTVWAWGSNVYGQLGTGSPVMSTNAATQVKFPISEHIVSVSAGVDHCLAMGSDGSLWAWGNNASGQLGVALASGIYHTNLPVLVGYQTQGAGSQWAGISAGNAMSLAVVNTNGTTPVVLSWGNNSNGQLGTGNTSSSFYPTNVLNSSDTAIFQF
jgi:alpha-tubulin suppressor-like RCC1 family protein